MAILPRAVISIIVNGIEFGLVLAFLVGPVFFSILQTSLERGFPKGVLVALGVSASDILYVTICYFGLAQLLANSKFKVYMAYAGGFILVGFGLYHLLIKTRKKEKRSLGTTAERKWYSYLLKGFFINGMTPMVLFFWIGTASVATIDFGYSDGPDYTLFFAALLATVLTTDILKAYLADKLRLVVTPRLLRIMNILLGAALIFFGCRLVLLANTISFV
jgi:threonine/homoserine/homoserine lactone efflux protein